MFIRSCFNLLLLISDAVSRTLRSFNMPAAKRGAKWQRDWRRLERQRKDYYDNGKLGSMVNDLKFKIASFSQSLETCYKSGELRNTIKKMAEKQSKYQGDFTLSVQEKCVGFFVAESLLDAITNRSEYAELKIWCENELEVTKACSEVGLHLHDLATVYSTQQAIACRCNQSCSSNSTMLKKLLFTLSSVLLLPFNFVGILILLPTLGTYDFYKIVPTYFIDDFYSKLLFVQQVTKTFEKFFSDLIRDNNLKLIKLLENLLSDNDSSVNMLLHDIPKKLARDLADLNMLAQQDEEHVQEYKRLLDETTDIWNHLAVKVIKLDVHKWQKDSLTLLRSNSSETSTTTSPSEDKVFDARLQRSTLTERLNENVVVEEIANLKSTSTAEMQKLLTVVLNK